MHSNWTLRTWHLWDDHPLFGHKLVFLNQKIPTAQLLKIKKKKCSSIFCHVDKFQAPTPCAVHMLFTIPCYDALLMLHCDYDSGNHKGVCVSAVHQLNLHWFLLEFLEAFLFTTSMCLSRWCDRFEAEMWRYIWRQEWTIRTVTCCDTYKKG